MFSEVAAQFRWGFSDRRARALGLAVFAIVYFVVYTYAINDTQISGAPFWPPDSVLLCALLLSPPRTWLLFAALTLPLRLLAPTPVEIPTWFLLTCVANDALKSIFAAGLLRRTLAGRTIRFDNLHDFWIYLAVTVITTPILSATAGAATWALRGRDFGSSWRAWFLGNALTHLVSTPMLVYLAYGWREIRQTKPARVLEALAIFAGLFLAVRFAYHVNRDDLGLVGPIDYIPVAFLLLAAIRFGPLGASGSLAIMSVLALEAAQGQQAVALHPELTSILSLQLFLIVIGVPTMILAVLLQQQRKTEQVLRENQDRLGRLNAGQQRMMEEMTGLHQRLISAQEDERRRIGRELHDDLNQQVSALGIHLSRIKRNLARGADPEELGMVESSLTHLGGAIHALSHELHPAFLERTGLGPALRAYCEEFKNVSGIRVHVRCDEILALSSDVALCLYRIAQEALRNAVRHSGASDIWVSLHDTDGQIHLYVKDSGAGFDRRGIKGNGIGLVSMEDRAQMAGGTLSVSSSQAQGTVLHCVVPWPAPSRAAVRSEIEHAKAKSAHRG